MPIEWLADDRQLHLYNGSVSLVLAVHESGTLGQLHVGAPLAPARAYTHLARRPFTGWDNRLGDPVGIAVPTAGSGDYRIPALVIEQPDGSGVLDLVYVGHAIQPGKPAIAPHPSTYVEDPGEADTVEIVLADRVAGAEVVLRLAIFRDHPAVARSMTIRNVGSAPLAVTTAMSWSIDLPDADWRMLQLSGAWSRERHVHERALVPGVHSIGSERGTSSWQQNPFIALRRPSATEEQGEVLGLSLVYAGNFTADVEVEAFGTLRARIGVNPSRFGWRLAPGEELGTPEAVLVRSAEGLGGMSRAYHRLYGRRLASGTWRDRERPVLLNNWEGTYFDFDEERIVEMARSAMDLGVELFVLDDGWFGARNSDRAGLGDWVVNRGKLPSGIDGLARRVTALGIGFGLWIEPEMVNPDSDLYRAHPDWVIGIPGRHRTLSRNQLVLDMGRPEVVDHIFGALEAVLRDAPVSYIKWDMNRSLTEIHSGALPPERQGEAALRHILGVYALYRRMREVFPQILFESCAGGGNRFDPAMLALAPQGWTSDDTDAIERLRIQWGSSLVYPPSSMGAHVSAIPNHQVGRNVPLATRAAVAFWGAFGYELDPTALAPADREEIRAQIAWYTQRRRLFQFGDFRRLVGPWDGDGNATAWMSVSDDRAHALVGWFRVLSRPEPGPRVLRLSGLDPTRTYRATVWPEDARLARLNAAPRGGDDLMANGLILDEDRGYAAETGDFLGRIIELRAEG